MQDFGGVLQYFHRNAGRQIATLRPERLGGLAQQATLECLV
jgi:hypothetical protein